MENHLPEDQSPLERFRRGEVSQEPCSMIMDPLTDEPANLHCPIPPAGDRNGGNLLLQSIHIVGNNDSPLEGLANLQEDVESNPHLVQEGTLHVRNRRNQSLQDPLDVPVTEVCTGIEKLVNVSCEVAIHDHLACQLHCIQVGSKLCSVNFRRQVKPHPRTSPVDVVRFLLTVKPAEDPCFGQVLDISRALGALFEQEFRLVVVSLELTLDLFFRGLLGRRAVAHVSHSKYIPV